jgi:hypothetical protein
MPTTIKENEDMESVEKVETSKDVSITKPKVAKTKSTTVKKEKLPRKPSTKKATTKAESTKEPVFCSVILSKGKRKGLPCKRKILQDTDLFCKFHLGKATEKDVCTVILTKGERKNKPCNRKVADNSTMCKIHTSLEEKRPYNPYVDKEADAVLDKDHFVSKICDLEVSKLNPECSP